MCNHHDPINGISKLSEMCKRRSVPTQACQHYGGFSTFTKQYLLVLLRFIEQLSPRHLRLFYTEPADYGAKWKKPLSYGLVNIVAVPTFAGDFSIRKALRAFVWVIWARLHDGSAFRFAPGSSSVLSTVGILRPEVRTLAAG